MNIALRPFYRRKYLLTKSEKSFYAVLRRILGDSYIFAKVRLADLVEADERHLLRKSNFDHIKSKHIDFVICDEALSPVIVIELDDSSHRRPVRVARDRDVDRILGIAELPILRVPVRRAYDPSEIAAQLLAKLRPTA
jgi:very-short-patch-repair endonuclease